MPQKPKIIHIYTTEEAEARIPEVLRSLALSVIEAMMVLESHSVRSAEFEKEVMAIRGYNAYLNNLSHAIWRTPKTKVRGTS